jgi:hypothetical protein
MENQEHNPRENLPAESPAHGSKARKKPAKVNVDTFIADWRSILASDKDPLNRLRPMVKVGFEGEVKGEHVSKIVASLLEHPGIAERLALPLAVQERFGKLGPLARRVLSELRASFGAHINYDPHEFSGYRAPRTVEVWVVEHAPNAPAQERDAWFRRFVVCLLKDSEPKTVLTGLVAAARAQTAVKSQKALPEEASFVRAIAQTLSQPIIRSGRLESILAGVTAVDSQFRQMLNREFDLERQLREQQDSVAGLRTRVLSIEKDLAEARSDEEKKAARIAELEHSAEQAAERYSLLDRHWRGVSDQQLAKQSGSFREKVRHEVQEALLAVDRDDPNVGMAIERLRRIEEILER